MSRVATFSSSSAWKLMTNDRKGTGFGAPALKYIKQVNYERRLGRPINKEHSARETTWGKLLEKRAFEMLDMSYQLVSSTRLRHPSLTWSGCPDLVKVPNVVADVKCPFSMEVFCAKLESFVDLEKYKVEYPEDFWQHISNAVLLELNGFPVTHFEAVIYMPYRSELEAIREMARNYDGEDQHRYKWIDFTHDDELPWLVDGGSYKNLNVAQFEIPEADKKALIERMMSAEFFLDKEAAA